MSIFKNTSTGMCLSQGEFGHTLNGRDAVLRKCDQYSDVLTPSSTLQGDENTQYMIKFGNNCLIPGSKNVNGDYKMITGNCDKSSYFKLYNDSRNINNQVVDKLNVYFIFSDNNTAYLDGTSRLWGKLLTYNNHVYSSNASEEHSHHYFVIYDFESNMMISEIMKDNHLIHCKVKYIVEEFNADNQPINVVTEYYLVPNENNTMLYFTNKIKESKRIFVETTSKSDYTNNDRGREGNNSRNFNLCRLGTMINSQKKYAKIDTRKNTAGMTLGSSATNFRMLTKDNIDEFKMLFHYPYDNNTHQLNLSSYINPVKKLNVNNKNNIKTINMRDDTKNRKALFSIIPKEEEGFTTLQEGYNGLIEGMTPRCEIKINGSCPNFAQSVPLNTSFLDSEYGGPEATTDYYCNVSAMDWKEKCGGTDVTYIFKSDTTLVGASIPESNDSLIIEEISKLYSTLVNDPTNFSTIMTQINAVLNNNIPINNHGNLNAFSYGTKQNLNRLITLFNDLRTLYEQVKVLKKNVKGSFQTLLLDNMFNKQQDPVHTIDINQAKKIISDLNLLMSQLKSLQIDVNVSRESKEAPLDLNGLNINLQFIQYIIYVLDYFHSRKTSIRSGVNTFYDYFNLFNDGSFQIYNNGMTFILTNNNSFDKSVYKYDSNTTLSSFIKNGTYFKDIPKKLFDIDFGEFYDMMYENSDSILQLDTKHMSNIIIPKYINEVPSNVNGGLFYYYLPLLKSQEEYYSLNSKCLLLKNKIDELSNIPGNSNYVNIISSHYSKIMSVSSNLLDNTDLTQYSFFKVLIYYNNLQNSGSLASSTFVNCYGNLKYIFEKSSTTSSLTYSGITHLREYYRDNILLQKFNMELINSFVTKYTEAYQKALIDSKMIDGGNIQYINETPDFIEGFSGLKKTTKEGLETMLNTTSNELFPSTPQSLNLLHKSDYSSQHVKFLNDAYLYRKEPTDNYRSFVDYVNNTVLNPKIQINGSGNAFICDDSKQPIIDIDYTCTDMDKTTTYNYKSIFNNNEIFNKCDITYCNMNRKLTLEDTNDGTVSIVITDDSNVYKKRLFNLSTYGVSFENLEIYATGDSHKEFTTVINDESQSLPLIENIAGEMSVTDKTIGGKNALLGQNSRVKLILYKGRLYAQCIPLLNKTIINHFATGTDTDHPINYSGNKVAVAQNNNFNDNDGNRPHSIALYDISSQKYKVGSNVNIHGYVGHDGVFQQTDDETTLFSHTIKQKNKAFKEYTGMCLGKSDSLPETRKLWQIVNSPEYVGFIQTDRRHFKYNSGYAITRETLKDIYKCQSPSKTTNTSDLNGTFYLKKFAIKSDQNACVSNPLKTDVINYDNYETNYMNSMKSFVSKECGIEKLLRDNINKFKQQRAEFQNKFVSMIQAFNELSENELKMLKDTNINIDNLNKHVAEYDELYQKATNNKTIKILVDSQKDDMSVAYTSSEYKMAVAGIASIGALIMMFNYMKK